MTDDAKPPPESEARMQLRTQLLLEVLNGKITGVQAAKRLGVSRKTWCEWQARGLEALRQSLSDRPTGRPSQPRDEEKEAMRRELENRNREIRRLEASLQIRDALRDLLDPVGDGGKKKP
jgi:transposase